MDRGLKVHSVRVTDVDYFGPRVGFIKFQAEVTKDGVKLPGVVFMRGGAVGILPILRCEGERHVVCTRQARVSVGHASFLELPAGMLDGSGHFSGVAAKEMREETGLDIQTHELVDLTALALGIPELGEAPESTPGVPPIRGMYPSPGGCDEFLRLYYYGKDVARAELDALKGKLSGNIEEGEVITLEVVPLEQLWRRTADAKALSALLLFKELLAAGMIKE